MDSGKVVAIASLQQAVRLPGKRWGGTLRLRSKEALIQSTRIDPKKFFVKSRLEKRRNILCISSFSSRRIGKKDPMSRRLIQSFLNS